MKYRFALSLAVLAAIAGSALAGPPSNDPALELDGYQVAKKTNAIVIDGKKTGSEWSEGKLQTFGANGEVDGIIWNSRNIEQELTAGFNLLWDPDPNTGGLYMYGNSDNLATQINSSGGVSFGGGTDSANIYFDPNTDGENSVASDDGVDGYQIAFNLAGPDAGADSAQAIEDGVPLTADIGLFYEAHVNTLWGNNGGSKFAGNGQGPLTALQTNGVKFSLATTGTANGWEFEMFMPWQMFDGCAGGAGNDGDGLCVGSVNGAEDVKVGDEWYFDHALYHDGNPNMLWAATAGGGDGFAQWAGLTAGGSGDPTIVFVDKLNSNPTDLNGDGAVDAADAGIMFGDWGGPGSTSAADFNKDGFVDAADAGTMFEAWTGDPATPGAKAATAEYNSETGELKISSAGAVNVFVQSASNAITPISPAPAVPVGLLTNNTGRVGITNLGPIEVSNFSFGNIGKGLAMSDLKLVYTTALGTKGIEVPAGSSDAFKYIPEPASLGLIGLGLAGLLAARRRA